MKTRLVTYEGKVLVVLVVPDTTTFDSVLLEWYAKTYSFDISKLGILPVDHVVKPGTSLRTLWVWEAGPALRGVVYCAIASTVEEARTLLFARYTSPDATMRTLLDGPPSYTLPAERGFSVLDDDMVRGLL